MRLVFEPPSKDTPGFLRRQRRALELKDQAKLDPTPATIDEMVEFLLPYVKEPEDRKEAADALWDASEEQFNQLLDVISGKGQAVPL